MDTTPLASGSQLPPQTPEPQHRSIGPAAGTIIIVVLLIAAGLYFWGAKLSQETAVETLPYIPDDGQMTTQTMPNTPEPTGGLPPQSTSDEAASIEADFEQMNLNSLESQTSVELDNL